MTTKVYYVQILEKRTVSFLSAANMKEAGKAAKAMLKKGDVLLGIYDRIPVEEKENDDGRAA